FSPYARDPRVLLPCPTRRSSDLIGELRSPLTLLADGGEGGRGQDGGPGGAGGPGGDCDAPWGSAAPGGPGGPGGAAGDGGPGGEDRKSTRLNSSHEWISYAVFCL